MKPFTKLAAIFFGIAGLIHLYRIVFPFRIEIWEYELPTFASIVFLVLSVILCVGLWKESKVQ